MSLLSDFLEWSCSLKMNNLRKPLPSCTVVKVSLPVLHTHKPTAQVFSGLPLQKVLPGKYSSLHRVV